MTSLKPLATALLLILLATARSSVAGDDHEQARQLHDAGEIVSLDIIIITLRKQGITRILEAELEKEDGRWLYEVEYLDDAGKVDKAYFDARNGQVLILDD